MNMPLIMALLAGQHRHRYNDSSGCCSTCGKVHEPHNWVDGSCTVCGFSGCEHDKTWVNFTASEHKCSVCKATAPHNFQFVHGDNTCQECADCGQDIAHSFSDRTAAACGACNVCGEVFDSHIWSNGKCSRCGYKCKHPTVDGSHSCSVCGQYIPHVFSDSCVDGCGKCDICGVVFDTHTWSGGKCLYCGYECKHSTVSNGRCDICGTMVVIGAYYVLSGIYEGSYVYEGTINGQDYYRQHQYDTKNGKWVTGNYYLVVIDIPTPTQFGGSYAYTGSGAAFVTSVESFPINNTLFSGNGRYNIHLKQYSLDGEYLAEGSYTSDDCKNITGRLP